MCACVCACVFVLTHIDKLAFTHRLSRFDFVETAVREKGFIGQVL